MILMLAITPTPPAVGAAACLPTLLLVTDTLEFYSYDTPPPISICFHLYDYVYLTSICIVSLLALLEPREGECLEQAEQLAGWRVRALGLPLMP